MTIQTDEAQDAEPTKNIISITPAAIHHLKKMLAKHQNSIGARLSVEDAGCSGKKYALLPMTHEMQREQEKNHQISQDYTYAITPDLNLYVAVDSLEFLKGTVIDYVKKGLNGRLIYHNPQEKASCGCGESFYV